MKFTIHDEVAKVYEIESMDMILKENDLSFFVTAYKLTKFFYMVHH